MIKIVNTEGGSLTAGQVVPFTLKYNTNSNTSFSSNEITVNKPGYYEIIASVVVAATGTSNIALTLYANGVPIPEASVAVTPASGNTYTLNLNDVEKIVRRYDNFEKVKFSFVISAACTLLDADACIMEIK